MQNVTEYDFEFICQILGLGSFISLMAYQLITDYFTSKFDSFLSA